MNAPHPFLCDVYGTKTAGVAGTLAAGMLTHHMMQGNEEAHARLLAEAEEMNRISRILEARKMQATQRGMSLNRGGIAPDMTNYGDMGMDHLFYDNHLFKGGAAQADATARVLVQGMDKEAIGALRALLPGLAKMVGSGGSKLLGAAAKSGGGTAGKLMGQAGSAMTRGAGRLSGVAKTQAMPAVTKAMTAGGSKALPAAAKAAPAVAAAPAAAKAPGLLRQTAGGVGQDLRAAGSAVKKAVTPGWRTKALLGGTALLGMGGLYSGGKAARDYMMQPSGMGGYQSPTPYGLRHNVSGFGGGYAY